MNDSGAASSKESRSGKESRSLADSEKTADRVSSPALGSSWMTPKGQDRQSEPSGGSVGPIGSDVKAETAGQEKSQAISGETERPISSPPIDWTRLIQRLERADRLVLLTHVRPDCDALGSTLALGTFLERMGKEVVLVGAFDVPPLFQFLDPQKRFRRLNRDVQPADLEKVDLIVILDTSAWAQLGEAAAWIRTTTVPKLVLDHHLRSDDLGAEEFKDSTAEATGRLVYELACRWGVEVDPMSATQLFAAIATDTGWFRFGSTQAGTYRLAAALTEAGAVPDRLYQQLYENDSLGRLRLMGQVLLRTQTDLQGRLIYSWIERSDFDATGALPSDTEDLINMLMTVAGTEVALMFIELLTGGVKVSFRSRSHLDCSQLAGLFGGGGHRQAAGAMLNDSLSVVRRQVLDAVRSAMQ